ncbi:hypothetical protein AB0J74_36660 [Asanoa sp. NPDC049573]|uniref:hypothetical protein n=1 Tax=Asanoa sp. NPDC049573 TaxID=3155396 RepID=UPI0034365A24
MPVIVHRRLETTQTVERPILVAVAGALGDDAVRFAFAEAALRGVPLLALTVWPGTAG